MIILISPDNATLPNQLGFYKYDDEGVEANPVTIVDSGVLKGFLMSRSPIDTFPRSNGHGRAQAGRSPVSRQSNMIVSTSEPVSDEALREKLITLLKEQDRPFGLFTGGCPHFFRTDSSLRS